MVVGWFPALAGDLTPTPCVVFPFTELGTVGAGWWCQSRCFPWCAGAPSHIPSCSCGPGKRVEAALKHRVV